MSTDTVGTGTLEDVGEEALEPGDTGTGTASSGPQGVGPSNGGGPDSVPLPAEPGEAELPQFGFSEPSHGPQRSMETLADVLMTISVELGRTKLAIRDLLNIHSGAVVQLDRQVTQPVDIFVHGTLIARGEVVVVDESFAVRVTELVTGD